MGKFKIIKYTTTADVYEVEAQSESEARDLFSEGKNTTPVDAYLVSTESEVVEEVDELQEALDSLNSDQYEVISAEIDRLKARIAELEGKQ